MRPLAVASPANKFRQGTAWSRKASISKKRGHINKVLAKADHLAKRLPVAQPLLPTTTSRRYYDSDSDSDSDDEAEGEYCAWQDLPTPPSSPPVTRRQSEPQCIYTFESLSSAPVTRSTRSSRSNSRGSAYISIDHLLRTHSNSSPGQKPRSLDGAATATTNNASMWWFFRIVFSSVFLLTVILSIPISFDVGGRDSGLAYSLSLFTFYVLYSTAKLATPEGSKIRWSFTKLLQSAQWVIIPALLIWSLHRFAVDANSTDWVSRTVAGLSGRKYKTWGDYLFGSQGLVESVTLGGWDKVLCYTSPIFQLMEGFCTLLVIQAAGQISKWVVNRGRSDTWVLILLIISASILASAVYFLWRVALFPTINNVDATLIGVTVTSAVFLCAIGIGSGRGNPIESSLLFAYVVLCVYQIFTDYVQSPEAAAAAAEQAANQPDFPPLPPIIMASYSTLMHLLGSLPSAVYSSLSFLYAAFQTIAPSVMISLTYRTFVFYAATRIIPAIRESGARALLDEPSLDDSDGANRLLGFLSWFSPSILIAVYTSLLLQHFSTNGDEGWTLRNGDAGGNVWRWVNIAATMCLYAVELYLGNDDVDGSLTNHWKTD